MHSQHQGALPRMRSLCCDPSKQLLNELLCCAAICMPAKQQACVQSVCVISSDSCRPSVMAMPLCTFEAAAMNDIGSVCRIKLVAGAALYKPE